MSPHHAFQYQSAWAYLDLGEIDRLRSSLWLFGKRRYSPASFQRDDHFGDRTTPLVQSIRSLVDEQAGVSFDGPVRVLTQLRHFGTYFSPISLFYCFHTNESLAAVVAEVSNTPWNERHCYVLCSAHDFDQTIYRFSHPKTFHVSPFMGMDMQYDWSLTTPEHALDVTIACQREGNRVFQADLHLTRVPLTDWMLARSVVRRPLAAAHILSAIYFEAFRLWMKKCQFYPHPRTSKETSDPANSAPHHNRPTMPTHSPSRDS